MSAEALEKRFTDLQDRLTVLQDATNQLQDLIERLANFNFQPGSVPLGANEDDNVSTELSSEINQILREQEEELELLQEEIIDIRPPGKPAAAGNSQHAKDRLRDGAQRAEKDLQNCRRSFRRAQITAKRNMQLAQKQERDLLYASFSNPPPPPPRSDASSPLPTTADNTDAAPTQQQQPPPRRRHHQQQQKARPEMSKDEQMLSASHSVTQSLRRTHDMMAAELAKSEFAHSALRESTAALATLSDRYSSLDSLLAGSRALLGTLLRSQKSDTWYLQSAFYLLVATLGWLVWRRLLWGPTWWLVWLPLKLAFRGALGVTGLVLGSSSELPASEWQQQQQQQSPAGADGSLRMNNEGVLTVQVDGGGVDQKPTQSSSSQGATEPGDSMVEEVGKIIDGSPPREDGPDGGDVEPDDDKGDGATGPDGGEEEKGNTVLRERTQDDGPPNPKKRVMVEGERTPEEHVQGRVRDEL
ncbi:Sec20-domain-containing protein [Xylariomycetidae sp. FL2044]|nr:Sec20-domain-containing protein [Xylariomycetidae sp. FL2044]